MEGICIQYNRDINCLRDKDKNIRLASLKRLSSELLREDPAQISQFFSVKLKIPLLESLSDPTDKCKELTVELLKGLLPVISQEDISHTIEALYSRLGIEPFPESCEEIRISEVDLLKRIISTHSTQLTPLLGNICDMLAKLAKDRCPDVKKQVAEIVVLMAKNTDLKIGYYGKKLSENLKLNLVHQQFRVRVSALEAIGELSLCENGQTVVETLFLELKKLQYDRRNEVRAKLYEVMHS